MDKARLLKRAAQEVQSGQIINLGIGMPTELMSYLPTDLEVMLHSENGILGCDKKATRGTESPDLVDAGCSYVTTRPGACFFDSSVSFAMIRRGRINLSVLGAFEVDQQGNLANWKIPGQFSPGIGGAMELAQKTPRLLVLCRHVDKSGQPKIRKQCKLPITASHCINRIITDYAVMDVTEEGLILREMAHGMELDELLKMTEAELIIPSDIGRF